MRVALVKLVVVNVNQPGLVEKTPVDAPAHARLLGQPLLNVEQQNLRQLRDRFGRPVIAPHQRLARAQRQAHAVGLLRAVAQRLGQGGLQIKHQPVFAPAGQQVQACTDQAQHGFVALQLAHLERRCQATALQRAPAVAQTGGARDPQNHLQVAQPAGRLLAVGLQCVRCVFVFGVALLHLQRLGDQKCACVQVRHELLLEMRCQRGVAAHPARLQQRGLHSHVQRCLAQAFAHGAHAGANFQAHVPAALNEGLYRWLHRRRIGRCGVAGQQQQHVHIGVRKQLVAAKTADRQQCRVVRHASAAPQRAQQRAGQSRQFAQPHMDAAAGSQRGRQGVQQRRLAGQVGVPQCVQIGQVGRCGCRHGVVGQVLRCSGG